MTPRAGNYIVLCGLLVFTLTDGSGQDAHFYGRLGDREFESGRAAKALETYRLAYRVAVISADSQSESRLLNNIGGCQLALFRYREAEKTLLGLRRSAGGTHDGALLGGVDGNLAAVYSQLDDLPTAGMYARESLQAYSRTDQPRQRPRALLTLANIISRQPLAKQSVISDCGRAPATEPRLLTSGCPAKSNDVAFREGEKYYLAGIRAATSLQDWTSVSAGWLHYGKALLEEGQLEDADRAFNESAIEWRKSQVQLRPPHAHPSGKMRSDDAWLWNVSRLRLRQHRVAAALEYINSAIRSSGTGGRIPAWRMYQTRADVELAQGAAYPALRDARTALEQARLSRANVIPDNDNRVGAEGFLDEAYSVLIEAGNQVYLKAHDRALLRETFEAAEENRAESLEALLATSSDWRSRLPAPQYWDKLSELRVAQRQAIQSNSGRPLNGGTPQQRDRVARLRSELSEMEEAAKATVPTRVGTILERVEKNLPNGACLLSFRLGDRVSWLWAVDHGGLQLYRLPPKAALLAEIQNFQDSIRDNRTDEIGKAGRRLYAHLFGALEASFAHSTQWFLSVDEPLFTVPLAALVVRVNENGPVYLTQGKTLQVLPGAQLFDAPLRGSLMGKRFMAAGDGIYNRADPRYGRPGLIRPASWGMARLPASGAEVRFAARLWRNHALLTGTSMTRDALLKEIDRDPDVIHIASHVISSQDRWRAGILALGLDASGEPDLLTPQEILLHPIHSRLVVMTGCSSGSGDALPASGLMGLTRAWLAAGAGAVLATRWRVEDEDQDGLIGSFYVHLLASRDGNIPQALQQARADMIRHGGWRAEARYWSGFFLIGVR